MASDFRIISFSFLKRITAEAAIFIFLKKNKQNVARTASFEKQIFVDKIAATTRLFKMELKPISQTDKKLLGYWFSSLIIVFFCYRASVLKDLKFFLKGLTDNPIVN